MGKNRRPFRTERISLHDIEQKEKHGTAARRRARQHALAAVKANERLPNFDLVLGKILERHVAASGAKRFNNGFGNRASVKTWLKIDLLGENVPKSTQKWVKKAKSTVRALLGDDLERAGERCAVNGVALDGHAAVDGIGGAP